MSSDNPFDMERINAQVNEHDSQPIHKLEDLLPAYFKVPADQAYPYEASAREIAQANLARFGTSLLRNLSREDHALLLEVVTAAAHDSIEFGEAIASRPLNGGHVPGLREKGTYVDGYLDALTDIENGQNKE